MNLFPLRQLLRWLAPAALVLPLAGCAAPLGEHQIQAQSVAGGDIQFMRAERALAAGDARQASVALARLDVSRLDEDQRVLYRVMQSEIALAGAKPLIALQALPARETVRNPALAARVERARALALFRMGDAVAGTQTLVGREALLTDPWLRVQNRELLWENLRTTDLDTAVGTRLAQADRESRGWVELAMINRSVWMDAASQEARLQQWRTDFPEHPGEALIPTFPSPELPARRELRKLALLLPLTGPFAATAEAVRDGFFAAYYGNESVRPQVLLYDTGSGEATLRSAYRRALNEGAEFIVGPLRREDVVALADQGRPPVPVLALNYLDSGQRPPFNFYQWGLAPEDEARQAAERAVIESRYRAIALVPEGDWGQRVLAAFRERLESLGGKLIAARAYETGARDHSDAIRALLDLDASAERHRAVGAALGQKVEYEPRRRDDVDLIFIAARPDQARLIWPQFRFHRASDLPIYATSLVYDGEKPDDDLNGIRFCDMPWMLAREGEWPALRERLQGLFPGLARQHQRLTALGYDSYTLVTLIEKGQLRPGNYFPAASGTLSLRDDGVVTRSLHCAEIRRGDLRPLDVSLAP
jgi:uncharacterized protein